MTQLYNRAPETLDSPSSKAEVVTPSDVTDLPYLTRYLYVGGTGNITAVMADGSVVLFSAVPVGTILPIQVSRVNATATTATLITALY